MLSTFSIKERERLWIELKLGVAVRSSLHLQSTAMIKTGNWLLGVEARKALQVFYQNIDCNRRHWIKPFNKVKSLRIDDLVIYSRWSYHLGYNKIHTWIIWRSSSNRSSVQPLAIFTYSLDNQISSWTLVTTRGREERGEFPTRITWATLIWSFFLYL